MFRQKVLFSKWKQEKCLPWRCLTDEMHVQVSRQGCRGRQLEWNHGVVNEQSVKCNDVFFGIWFIWAVAILRSNGPLEKEKIGIIKQNIRSPDSQ